jgi:hypothetical protein
MGKHLSSETVGGRASRSCEFSASIHSSASASEVKHSHAMLRNGKFLLLSSLYSIRQIPIDIDISETDAPELQFLAVSVR